MDERLGSHVVLWIVDEPELWANAIEAAADAEVEEWPRKHRGVAEFRRSQRYEGAARVRADGPGRLWRGHHHSAERAAAEVAALWRSHPNPGVRYEAVEITDVGACATCQQPTIRADGEWRHHLGGYPVECARRGESEPAVEGEREDGEWEISTSGYMICGYCNKTQSWAKAMLGYWQLTGFHLLGIERATGTVVVLAEATSLRGERIVLPHHCEEIPDEVRAAYAPARKGT